jgi:hypothetical protein
MAFTMEDFRRAADRWTNPILLKELRATFRGWWFLAVHTAFLGLLAIAVVIVVLAFGDEGNVQPARVGRWLHQVYVAGLALAAVSILPSFASTALVSEREQNTFEMLQTTTLDPAAVIRGKFLAAMVYTALFLFSSLPVWAVAFLYGGVAVTNLVAAFGLILALSALSNIVSVFVSAYARSSRTALMGTAAAGITLAAGIPSFLLGLPEPLQVQAALLLGIDPWIQRYTFIQAPAPWTTFLYLFAVPAFLWTAFFAFSAISATNHLKSRSGNRSTNLKVFYLAFLVGAMALWWAIVGREAFTSSWDRWAAVATLFGAAGMLATLSAFFAAEEPVHALPAVLRRPARLRILQPFLPGSWNGFAFTLVVNAVLLLPAVFLATRFLADPKAPDRSFLFPLAGLSLTILGFLFLCASWGVLLSTFVRQERFRMALQSLLVILLLFGPLVAFAVLHRFRELPFVSIADPGLLSPVVAFGSLTTGFFETVLRVSKDTVPVSIFPFEARLGGAALPAFLPSLAFDLLLGSVLLAVGLRRLRRASGKGQERVPLPEGGKKGTEAA